MMRLNLRGSTGVLGYRLAVVVLAVGLAGCASMGGATIPAVGTWATTVDSPAGVVDMTLTINPDMSGTGGRSEPAEANVGSSGGMVDGQSLAVSVMVEFQGAELPATCQGTVDGDAITGEFETAFGNAMLTGTRN